MYNYQELTAMDLPHLREIAEKMGMKKTEDADAETVAYYILDNQAEASAKEQAEKLAQKKQIRQKAKPLPPTRKTLPKPQQKLQLLKNVAENPKPW